MVGEVALGGIQTADAIAGLTTTVIRVVRYCRQLKAAPQLAKGVLDRIEHWEGTLESITYILQARKQHVVPQLSSIESVQFEKNVEVAISRLAKTLNTIGLVLGVFNDADAQYGKVRYNLWVRGKLVSKQDELNRLLEALDDHQKALKWALDILQWHDDHQILQDRLRNLGPPNATSDALSDGFEAEIEAHESLASMQETARQLLRGRPTSDDSTTLLSEGRTDSCSPSLATAPTHDLDALDHFVREHTELSQQCMEKAARDGDYRDAKQYLLSAIKYADQREFLHQVRFDDRVQMQFKLAQICREMRHWQEALRTVHDGVPEENGDSISSDERQLYTAQRSYLLSSIYYGRYMSDESRETQQDDRRLADEYAKKVLALWPDHRMLQPDQADISRACLEILVGLYNDQGENVEARFYQAKLDERAAHPERAASTIQCPFVDDFLANEIPAIDALCRACEESDKAAVKALIFEHGVDINATGEHGSVLGYAASSGNENMLKYLLEKGANINTVDEHGHTALSKAVLKNHVAVVSILLKWRNGKADTTTIHDREGTLLHLAVKHKDVQCSQMLLQHTPSLLGMKDRYGKSTLHYAAHAGNLRQATLLLDKGIARNELDNTGYTPLSLTLKDLNPDDGEAMFNLLFDNGAMIGDTKLTKREEFTRQQYVGAGERPERRATTAGRWIRFEQQQRPDRAVTVGHRPTARRLTLT